MNYELATVDGADETFYYVRTVQLGGIAGFWRRIHWTHLELFPQARRVRYAESDFLTELMPDES